MAAIFDGYKQEKKKDEVAAPFGGSGFDIEDHSALCGEQDNAAVVVIYDSEEIHPTALKTKSLKTTTSMFSLKPKTMGWCLVIFEFDGPVGAWHAAELRSKTIVMGRQLCVADQGRGALRIRRLRPGQGSEIAGPAPAER